MTTNNHPAHGPVSRNRLHQIREILSKASAQSDGGNLGYAMADAVKVIDGAIAAFGAEPVAYMTYKGYLFHATDPKLAEYSDPTPLYDAPPAPVVPTFDEWLEIRGNKPLGWVKDAMRESYDACRAAMLQAGNSPVTPDGWIPVIERVPLTPYENCLYEDVEVQVFDGEDVFIAHYAIGALPEPWGAWVDTAADITHWRPLAEPPRNK
ncbi:hypothetical protein ACM6O4_08980 [Citrobacter portucalensis]|uniref:hypothetical protein n=1 Tax=Citrobacter portucalensis TaxID=1639133 RepID=UPI0039FC3294